MAGRGVPAPPEYTRSMKDFVADVHPEEHRQRAAYIDGGLASSLRSKYSFDGHYDSLSGNALNTLLRATGSVSTPFCGTSPGASRQMASQFVPSKLLRRIRRQGRVYNVRWSPSGRLLASATQDESIELHAEGRWRAPIACIEAQDVAWAVTSVDMTEDDALLAYASMQSTVHLVDIRGVAARAAAAETGSASSARSASSGGGSSAAGGGTTTGTGGGGRRGSRGSSSTSSFSAAAAAASASSSSSTGAELLGTHVPLDFSAPAGVSASASGLGTGAGGGRRRRAWDGGFPIYQLRFSAGGSEIIAACGDHCVVVWDVERERVAERIPAHDDDINTVAFVDGAHRPHLLATGSDDCMIKIWDRRAPPAVSSSYSSSSSAGGAAGEEGSSSSGVATRSRRSSSTGAQRPAGYLAGHLGGLTSIASRCDGRYLASNGKDLCAKLWDVRRATTSAPRSYRPYPYDYRMRRYPGISQPPEWHPSDASILTMRGHNVHETLIRCEWSPLATTGQRYLCSGDYDGAVCVWDVASGDLIRSIRCSTGVDAGGWGRTAAVRDVSWHPTQPLIAAACFDGAVALLSYDEDAAQQQASASAERKVDGESRIRRGRRDRAARLQRYQSEKAQGRGAAGRGPVTRRRSSSGAAAAAESDAADTATAASSDGGSGSSGNDSSPAALPSSSGSAAASSGASAPVSVGAGAGAGAAADASASSAASEASAHAPAAPAQRSSPSLDEDAQFFAAARTSEAARINLLHGPGRRNGSGLSEEMLLMAMLTGRLGMLLGSEGDQPDDGDGDEDDEDDDDEEEEGNDDDDDDDDDEEGGDDDDDDSAAADASASGSAAAASTSLPAAGPVTRSQLRRILAALTGGSVTSSAGGGGAAGDDSDSKDEDNAADEDDDEA